MSGTEIEVQLHKPRLHVDGAMTVSFPCLWCSTRSVTDYNALWMRDRAYLALIFSKACHSFTVKTEHTRRTYGSNSGFQGSITEKRQ